MVMFSQDDNGDTIRRAVQAGVSAYVVDGVQAQRVRPIMEAAIARFGEHRRLQAELDRTRSKLEERKKIERAKGVVMMQRGVGEPAAYALMRKAAMDQNRRLVEIADSIITAADLLGGREVGS
jgi:response regulator NasT